MNEFEPDEKPTSMAKKSVLETEAVIPIVQDTHLMEQAEVDSNTVNLTPCGLSLIELEQADEEVVVDWQDF